MLNEKKETLFITFEGPEGSGKTTIIRELQKMFKNHGIEIIVTREPGGSIISEEIRQILLNNNNKLMDSWTEVLLYIASRRQHFIEKIRPELKKKHIVFCDRFSDSTIAYQGYGRDLDINKIEIIQKIVLGNFEPDLTFYLDIVPEIGLQRVKKRNESELNRLDKESLEFHNKVYEGYKKLALLNSQRIKIINAKQELNLVLKEVYELIIKELDKF